MCSEMPWLGRTMFRKCPLRTQAQDIRIKDTQYCVQQSTIASESLCTSRSVPLWLTVQCCIPVRLVNVARAHSLDLGAVFNMANIHVCSYIHSSVLTTCFLQLFAICSNHTTSSHTCSKKQMLIHSQPFYSDITTYYTHTKSTQYDAMKSLSVKLFTVLCLL